MKHKIAVIDLGSNSVRMIIMRINENGSYIMIEQVKEMVRLSEGLQTGGRLLEEPVNRTIQTLKLFQRLLVSSRVDAVYPVATEAVRRAENREWFVELVQKETGFIFDVIDGLKEAYYDYLGVINTIKCDDFVLLDTGGGSSEIVLVRDKQFVNGISIPYGSITLTDTFSDTGSLNAREYDRAAKFMREQYQKLDWLQEGMGLPVIGLGGSIRTLVKVEKRKKKRPYEALHNFKVSYDAVKSFKKGVLAMLPEERKQIAGMDSQRADIITAGILPLDTLMRYINAEQLIVSGNGLREGVFFEKYAELTGRDRVVDDCTEQSIYNIIKNYNLNVKHAEHVRDLSLKLFDAARSLHGFGNMERELLSISAFLHDIGKCVNYYNHEKHGFYLVLNCQINGLTYPELVRCAYIVSMHRVKEIKNGEKEFGKLLPETTFRELKKVAVFLQIAEQLDASEMQNLLDVNCSVTNRAFVIKVSSDADVDLEINNARKLSKIFEKLYSRSLEIKYTGGQKDE